MYCLSWIAEHVEIVKLHYKNTDFLVGIFPSLRADYKRDNRPFERTIGKIVTNLNNLGL